ncbi:MAG TPA: type I polyketide synthase, partial [Thermoanaerobaculia bacterium]
GISCNDYYEIQTGPWDHSQIDAHTSTGGARSIAANRISYTFDLRGPSLSVDTACSSSLVAVHLACRSLWSGEVSLALAGGVNAILTPSFSICLSKLAMLSPDGRSRAFDAGANGYVRAEGAGIVVLKPLSAALAGGDRIYAVIRGTAVNQDGATNGITVPSAEAQEEAVRAACRAAGVLPARLQYVEAHGTGTPVGDPIEATALGRVLREGRPASEPCRIGSVKTNFGHAESAAGIAGVIKTALALHHREIPASLHFETPNPDIAFDDLRLRVAARPEIWPSRPGSGLAGVNSFGFGGTNAHVVLGEAPGSPAPEPAEDGDEAHVFPISVRSRAALRALARAGAELLEEQDGEPPALSDLCYSAAMRRGHRLQSYRAAFVARSREELARQLLAFGQGEASEADRRPAGSLRRPVFVFCGQGPQHWGMARELVRQEPLFRESIERCDALLLGHAGWSLLDELTAPEERSLLDRTDRLQPALFAIQVALADLWRSWGVEPAAAVGHSLGEIAAAHVAGAISLKEAVQVVFHRSRLQQRATGTGRMMSCELAPEEAASFLDRRPGRLWLAAVNGPRSVTLAGEGTAVEETAAELERAGVFTRVLRIACACHTPHMEPFRDELLASLADLRPRETGIPFWSTVYARPLQSFESGAGYWWENFRRPVLFRDAVRALAAEGHDLFLEIGPHPVLSAPLRQAHAESGRGEAAVFHSLRRGERDRETLLASLASLHGAGVDVAWSALFPQRGRLVRLPSYPWQRERHWRESEESRRDRSGDDDDPLLGRRLASPMPSWQQDLDLRALPWLADHRIQGALVVPGVFYILTALAAARRSLGGGPAFVQWVELQRALFIPEDGAPRMRLELSPEDGTFEVFGRTPDRDAQWTRHARGSLVTGMGGGTAEPRSLATIRERCREVLEGADFYSAADRRGIQLGSAFQK